MIPETRYSLISRLSDDRDQDAWAEFETVYRPVVYNSARKHGLQDADAQDLVQQVMISIARALKQRPHDRQRAKFRTWLFSVTRNAIINSVQRRPNDLGVGNTDNLKLLQNVAQSVDEAAKWESDYQRAIFHWAANKIRQEFADETWQAFWLTTVDGISCEAAAEKLGKEVGSIYAARSRIVRRLKKKVEEFDQSSQML